MRKLVVIIIALATLGFLAGPASAGKIKLSGTHSADEIRTACANVDGSFVEGKGNYSCINNCGGEICEVNCSAKNQECTGTCPKCGRRELSLRARGCGCR
jgi:hypothetical protein